MTKQGNTNDKTKPAQISLHSNRPHTNPIMNNNITWPVQIKEITKLPNFQQSYKGKVKTHNYINRQSQSSTGKLRKRNDPDLV